jgi:hypothetical protein
MIASVLLPLADFKTITVDASTTPSVSTVGTEIAWALGLLGLLLILFLLPRLWRAVRPVPKAAPENWILVDGSNVMHWQDNSPSIEPVRKVIARLRDLGYVPGVVFDANAGWKLAGRYLHDDDFARMLKMEPRQVMVVAKGTQADPYLLETAREFGARIVSNDRFRDWAEKHPEVTQPGFLIRGNLRDGAVRLAGLEQAEPVASGA